MFDDLAPKYAKRAEELGTKGGYTRVLKTHLRRGDNAQMAIDLKNLDLVDNSPNKNPLYNHCIDRDSS